jgi:hypothetical protein
MALSNSTSTVVKQFLKTVTIGFFSSKWFERTLRRSVVCLVGFTMFPNINVVFTSSFLMQFFNVHQFESDQCCQATTLHELRDSKSGLTTVVDCDTYVRIVVSVGVSMAFVTWRFSRFLGLSSVPTQFQVRNGYQDESVTSAQYGVGDFRPMSIV